MLHDFITGLFVFASLFGFGQQSFGAFSDPFLSVQLAASPTNGDCLTTDGTNNSWDTCAGGPGGTIDGSGTAGNVAYWSDSDTLTSVATGTVSSANSALTVTSNRYVIGGSLSLTVATTTTSMFTGTAGQVLAYTSSGWTGVATTTFSGGLTYSAGNVTNTMTAGDGITRNTDDLDCDTASGSVFGCLSTTDWSTFNSKLGSYDAWTHPAATQSATTSLLFFNGFVSTASSTVNGSLNILGNATATNATTTTLYNSGQTRLGALASSLVLSGSTGILSNYAGIGCTNQVVEDVSAAGAGTCVSINNGYWSGTDLSVANGGTGLSTFGGTNTVLYTTAADTLSSEAAFTYSPSTDTITVVNQSLTNGTSTNYEVTGTASSTAVVVGKTIRLFGTVYSTLAALGNALVNAVTAVTPTGTWDFGGATSVEIVNGAAPTVDAIGEIALDTTANQLLIATSTNASFPATFPLEQPLFSVTIGSTTPEFVGSNGQVPISRWVGKAREVTRVECFVTGGTSKVVNITDGTNDTETTTCGTTNTQDNSLDTNSSFTASELWYIELGATTGAVNYVTYTAYGYVSRE